jgi:Arrestin (or S-antigen), N-terminal domain
VSVQVSVPMNISDHKLSKPGQYQYPFQFKLPEYAPPSCEFNEGHARYVSPSQFMDTHTT